VDSELVRHAQRLLDRARVLAEAPAGKLDQVIRQAPGSRLPVNTGRALLDRLGQRVNQAIRSGSRSAMLDALEWGEREIRRVTHSPDTTLESREEFRARVIKEYEGRPARMICDQEHISVTLARRIREQAGRDPRTGRKVGASDG
jgi:hypothetical protein